MITMFLAVICLLLTINYVSSDSLLLLGDSIDRNTATDWCGLKDYQGFAINETEWGQEHLIYRNKRGILGTYFCRTESDSIGFVHIFGSSATGPYWNNLGNNSLDIYEDTKARLNYGIKLYTSIFGKPDRIIFHTNTWDTTKHKRIPVHDADIRQLGNQFRVDILLRINEILQIIDKSVDLGLRTAVWYQKGGKLCTEFNRITRNIAEERNMTLYDFDRDAWSTLHYDYTQYGKIFRDDVMHPNAVYNARAGEKILGRQYSSAIIFRGEPNTDHRFNNPSSNSTVYLWHDISINTTFYVHNCFRHAGPDKNFLTTQKLGPYDIRYFTDSADLTDSSLYKNTALGASFPPLLDRTVFNKTTSNELLHYLNRKLRVIDISIVIAIGVAADDIIQLKAEDEFWLLLIGYKSAISYVYLCTSDYLLKKARHRDVFFVRDAKRIYITDGSYITATNKSFDDILVIKGDQDIDFLPLSHELLPNSTSFFNF